MYCVSQQALGITAIKAEIYNSLSLLTLVEREWKTMERAKKERRCGPFCRIA